MAVGCISCSNFPGRLVGPCSTIAAHSAEFERIVLLARLTEGDIQFVVSAMAGMCSWTQSTGKWGERSIHSMTLHI